MKMKIAITIGLPKPGSFVETDGMANSLIFSGTTWYGGPNASFEMPSWAVGEKFALDIPSGIFSGIVQGVESYGAAESEDARNLADTFGGAQPSAEGIRLYVVGEWNGKDGGIVSGLCAFGRFQAHLGAFDAVVTESTLLPMGKEVPYGIYDWAKSARTMLGIDNEGVKNLLEHMIAVREEAGEEKRFEIFFQPKAKHVNPIEINLPVS